MGKAMRQLLGEKPVHKMVRKYLRGYLGGQSGAEFGKIVLYFMIFIFATMQGVGVLNAYNFVTYAARDAARYAMVHGATSPSPASSDDIKKFVIAEAQGIDTSPLKLTVTTTWTPPNNKNPGSVVNVTVAYNFAPFTRIASNVTWSVRSTSKMVISQ